MTTLKSMKIDDFYNKGQIMTSNMYLFEVKTAKESTTPWDYYKTIASGDQAFTTVAESGAR
jgi:branched-chain amino acid transport system substrate-binding protein